MSALRGLLAAGLLALAPVRSGAAQEARSVLLATERAASALAGREGLGAALERYAAPDLVYLHPAAPLLSGAATIGRALGAQRLRAYWTPTHAEVSGDGSFAAVYGVLVAEIRPDSLVFGRYLSAWRLRDGEWRLVALAHVGAALPAIATETMRSTPRIAPAARHFAEQDRAFAAQAGREGAGAAFAAHALQDAVVFGAFGELIRGPEPIRAAFGPGPSQWEWAPVAGDASPDGGLGFTVGEAVIRRRAPDGSWTPSYSKYLTLWRRTADGRVGFLADGGNARPPGTGP